MSNSKDLRIVSPKTAFATERPKRQKWVAQNEMRRLTLNRTRGVTHPGTCGCLPLKITAHDIIPRNMVNDDGELFTGTRNANHLFHDRRDACRKRSDSFREDKS